MTCIYYTLIPLLLLLTAVVLLRKRGMKSMNGTGVHWDMFREDIREASLHPYDGEYIIPWGNLLPQEKSNPTTKENENG